ncbi:hypothetical protein [Halovenus marina]|uniref:hypothetical protein n=1 Tax=Halovenus marina TaxID=3396621 RepID=UPI003F575AFB
MTDRRPYEPSRRQVALELLTAYRYWIGATALLSLLVGGVLLWVYGLPSLPSVPESVQAAALATIGAGALGYVPAWAALNRLHNPPKRHIVVPGLKEDADPGMWELTPNDFAELTVEDGELYEWPGTKHPTYEVEAFDPEQLHAVATWRGSVTDSELIREQERIEQIRGKLEQRARERDVLEVRGKSLVRQAVMEERRTFLEEYDRVALLDAETYDRKLEEVLEETDLQADLSEQANRKQNPTDADSGEEIPDSVRMNGDTDE